jgi:acetylornithine deacetylase/succinyl-diaminopimelate desuccinylase-like protein
MGVLKTRMYSMALNVQATQKFINQIWDDSAIPTLQKYITIPCKSPNFDAQWQQHGYIDQAIELLADWCRQQNVKGMQLNIHRLPERTPVLVLDIAGDSDKTILLYGHLDKQPEMEGWHDKFHPWKPVLENNRLYGRGGADDGYSTFAALTAIKALQEQNIPHARCVILIEACEESGSTDLPYYLDNLQDTLGEPDLVICLDSGCGNYDQLWCTTSLRGNIIGVLSADILQEGVHSGAAGGIVPSSFRILRQLLNRLEETESGKIVLKELQVAIPKQRMAEATQVAETLGEKVWTEFPFVSGARPVSEDLLELVLNRTWRASLSFTGIEGIPHVQDGGNVLRPRTAIKLSLRLPPLCNAKKATQAVKQLLESNPPYKAKVEYKPMSSAEGWNAPETADWLQKAINKASENYFKQPALWWGEGGTIPFMAMLGEKFPRAQFMITGVLGPHANAHGPNEFLDLPTAKRLTACVAEVISAHFAML